MNYKDLKNGDVIKIIDYTTGKESTSISIVNKVEIGTILVDSIYTYADLDMDDEHLSVEKYYPGCSYIANKYRYELATEEEKNKLYESLFALYTKVDNPVWDKHSLRNFFDIQDFLFDIFCIKVEEYDDHLIYPKFVDNIVDYILRRGFEVLGMTSGFEEEESNDIMVSLEKTIKYFEPILRTYCSEECLKELMNGYINHIIGIKKSEQEKHIEHMLSDDWEGDEEIFIPEEECSKPFNTPKILGEID